MQWAVKKTSDCSISLHNIKANKIITTQRNDINKAYRDLEFIMIRSYIPNKCGCSAIVVQIN